MTNDGMTGTATDAIELLTTQHREVDQLWSQFQTTDDLDLRNDLARRIITMLSQHDAIETMLLYPALREAGASGLADHSLEEHQQVRELLKEADGKDANTPEAMAALREALQNVQHHVREEEGQAFPQLREHLDGEQLMALGEKMAKAMKTAPTHPHPSTPNNPVGAAVAGTVSGIVDRARDALHGDR